MPHSKSLVFVTLAALLAHSCGKLVASVFGDRLVKSEFETEAQYHARIERMRPSGSYLILAAPNFVRYVYSAEIQRLVVFANQGVTQRLHLQDA